MLPLRQWKRRYLCRENSKKSACSWRGGLHNCDHGNLEKMYDGETNQPYTAHTTNPVPFLMVSADRPKLHEGILADIAPTLLELLGIAQPAEMTGHSLIEK